MKELSNILHKVSIVNTIGTTNLVIADICFDSRKAKEKSLFVATKGTQVDGNQYINQAIEQGATAIICESIPKTLYKHITYLQVEDSSIALGTIASNFYDNPSNQLQLIGITGTNGKTTSVTLLYNLFQALGYKVGLISTIKNKFSGSQIEEAEIELEIATHTTPDALKLNALLRTMVDNGCSHCFMEVSSHAIAQNRIAGISFKGGVFTNITHDHLDYHLTFDEYIKAKKKFFDNLPKEAFALVNKDDVHSKVMLQNTKAKMNSYALQAIADYKCKILENQFSGLQLSINNKEVWSTLIGKFNAYNLLVVYAVARLLNENEMDVLTAISKLLPVEGRFHYFQTDKHITAIIDYAHTPDALKNILHCINDIRTGSEQVITVFGCGGNRDKEKRPLMAKIAYKNSNKVIITSDNPRNENPEDIIADIMKGVDAAKKNKVLNITNRKEAIKTACAFASDGDIILIAGKGHEKYQEIKGERFPFDDMHIAKEMLGFNISNTASKQDNTVNLNH